MPHPDSGYDGPVRDSVLTIGGRTIHLARPEDPDRLLTDPAVLAWNARDDYMPYWAYLWPGAFLLAEAVSREPWAPGTRALELGCGLGLAGLAGLASGLSHVSFTDYDEAPFRFVRRSAGANSFHPDRFSTSLLDWRSPPDQQYPVILGADILYEKRLVPLVLSVLDRMLSPTGFALVAGPYRVASDDLSSRLSSAGFHHESSPLTAPQEDGQPIPGTLHRIWKR